MSDDLRNAIPDGSADPRVPHREDCVAMALMERRVADAGNDVLVYIDQGEPMTYAAVDRSVRGAAAGLQALGVEPGDRVLGWLPTGYHAMRAWLATTYAGATHVPINTAYRGTLLEHVVHNSDARVGVVHADLAPRLREIDTGQLETLIIIGGEPEDTERHLPATALDGDADTFRAPDSPPQPWDVQSIVFTSGTTGPSKGVLLPYAQLYESCRHTYYQDLKDGGRFMVNLPFFHIGGQMAVLSAIMAGASVVLVPPFSTKGFWDVVKRTQGTSCALMGAMADYLHKAEERPDEADNTLKTVWMAPLIPEIESFERRFRLKARTAYNMTEMSVPILVMADAPAVPGSCGRLRPGAEVRLVDEFDREVPEGAPGEAIVRTDAPWTMTPGYNANPEATVGLYRNGWLHTGDFLRRDSEGNYYFLDRKKDSIRRRGENISSYEVEAELLTFPAVQEAAAVGVTAEEGEDEVMAVVAPVAGQSIDPEELLRFLMDRMAHFMVPRYIRVMDELPKGQTSKIQKFDLREEGVTPDAWDRVEAGITVRRDRLGS